MNNLKPMRIRSIPAAIDGQIIHISDEDNKKVFYLDDDNLLQLKLDQEKILLCDARENIIRVEYMQNQSKISLVTATRLVVIDCISKDSHICRFDEDLVDICWNSTYDYFIALFVNDVVKTYIFTPTLECLIHGSGSLLASVPETDTVGWGSETTQFQIDRSGEHEIEECAHIPPTDNKKPSISWAENKLEFVVSYVDNDVRKFKVFDHLCLPKTISKLPEGELYGPVAWKPHGSIIAAAVHYNEKNCVVFFEQNGLTRHILPLEQLPFPITCLAWSTCGSVLSVTQEDDSKQRHISLFATSNYRWYLKQHLIFPEDNFLYNSTWLATNPKCVELLVVTKKQIVEYKYRFQFQRDSCQRIIATIDGKNVIFYNFMESITPPPTCFASVKFSGVVNMLEFHNKNGIMAAIDDSNFIHFVSTKTNVQIISKTFLYEQIFPLNVNHLFWKMDCPNVIIDNNTPDFTVSLYEFETTEKRLIEKQNMNITSNDIEEIVSGEEIIIVYGGNKRRVYCNENSPIITNFPSNPLQVIPFTCEDQIYCFLLTTDQELYIENDLLSKGITSIMIFSGYLLFTDDSTLYTVELNSSNISGLAASNLNHCHKRPLNEVMYLVGMAGNATSTILYTPRGTLDTISSLPLEIKYINNKIDEESWEEVIYFMRLFKMNWNLLIDLNSSKFYSNFEKIITVCHRKGVLNALIDEITDQDYGNIRNAVAIIPPTYLNKKQEFFTHLDSLFAQKGAYCQYFPTVMKICLDQANLKKAMLYASNLLKVSKQLLVQAIKLLKIRVEAQDLFNAALQIFDLKLAAFIATQCQMNPQEVDPLLDELGRLSELDRRITIHLKFRNWGQALPYMLRSDTYPKKTILLHIQAYDLAKAAYREAVTLNLPYLKEIILIYIEKLARAMLYKEAAVLCAQHGLSEEALELFKFSLDHVKCIEYLGVSKLSAEARKDFLKDLAERLILGNRICEAAVIYEEHLDDPASAIRALVEGNKFKTALRIGRTHKMRDLIVNEVVPKMLQRLGSIAILIEENNVKFTCYANRLKEIRFRKKIQMAHMNLGNAGISSSIPLGNAITTRYTQPDVDMESIITFGSSVSSSASSSSRKMLRKLEKQKQDITEGSRFEDIALIREMHILLTGVFQFGTELRELFLILVELCLLKMNVLHGYQTKLFDTQQKMEDEAKIIWNEDFKIDSTCKYMSENISYLDEKYRTPPPEISCPGSTWALEILK